jgi:NADH-quinone oxidoreductase subunit L
MHGDERFHRFFTYLNLFAASMLTLVLAGNYAMLFLGWELVGLCSYLLIGFWFTRPGPAPAAKKAFVVNRIGDFGFMVGLMLVFTTFGTLSYSGVFERAGAELTTGLATASACCSWSARRASRHRYPSMSGFPTRWRARLRCQP